MWEMRLCGGSPYTCRSVHLSINPLGFYLSAPGCRGMKLGNNWILTRTFIPWFIPPEMNQTQQPAMSTSDSDSDPPHRSPPPVPHPREVVVAVEEAGASEEEDIAPAPAPAINVSTSMTFLLGQ